MDVRQRSPKVDPTGRGARRRLSWCLAGVLVLASAPACAPLGGPLERVENDASGLYFKNRRGVYIFMPRDCGFLGCFGPDLRLVKYSRVRFADPATFRILFEGDNTFEILARDREHVFWGGEYVPTGDVDTLRLFDGYATDKNNLYFRGVTSGVDTTRVRRVGGNIFSDGGGPFLATSSPPQRTDLADGATFEFYPSPVHADGRDYVAGDRNFRYYNDGGSYRVDPRPGVEGFEKLGCGYYRFRGQIFYSLHRLAAADAATFRVLGAHDGATGRDVERCDSFYAVDKDRRYEFDLEVRPQDGYRNHRIAMLLAAPADRKAMSKQGFVLHCVRRDRPFNFDYALVREPSAAPGAVSLASYVDARLLESSIADAAGRWQPLPAVGEAGSGAGCEAVHVERFSGGEAKPWLSRRDPSSVSLVVNASGRDPIFVAADGDYTVRLAFSKTSLTKVLREGLRGARVEPPPDDVPGWGSGWILEDNYFLGGDGRPEVWMPLHIKGAQGGVNETYVTVGLRHSAGRFECIDEGACEAWGIPRAFDADFR